MEQNYITILIESLEKKIKVLDAISLENQKQKEILQGEELDTEAFEASIDSKAKLIDEIAFLDEGFQEIYDRVKETLQSQRDLYKQEIATLQQLIGQITDRTVKVQKEEWDNRNLAEIQFSNSQKKVRQVRASSQVANKYYNSMSKINYIDPQFMDKKK